MKIDNYFKKNGHVYGIEGDLNDGQGYRVYNIKEFTDYKEAIQWTEKNNNPYRRRFLATYTEKRYYESNCLVTK